MKPVSLLAIVLFFTPHLWASPNYMNTDGSLSRVIIALEDAYGIGAGVGTKNNSCLLCHASSSGGPGNINSTFGRDFVNAASALNFGDGSQLPAIGSLSLSALFSHPVFADLDSDGDGEDNGTEFAANTDPADNVSEGGSSGGGGGCGIITTKNNGEPPGFLILVLMMIPLFLARLLGRIYVRNWSIF